MNRNQRGGTRGVHRDRRPLQAQHIRDPPGRHAEGAPGQQVAVVARGRLVQAGAVLGGQSSDEHPRRGAAQAGRVDARVFERLPGDLQHHPLLRIHPQRLTRRDPEELRVEPIRVVQEPSLPRVRGSGVIRIRMEQLVKVPPSVGGERPDRVHPVRDQPPQIPRRAHPARITATDAHDGDRFACPVGRTLIGLLQPLDLFQRATQRLDELFVGCLHLNSPIHSAARSSRGPAPEGGGGP